MHRGDLLTLTERVVVSGVIGHRRAERWAAVQVQHRRIWGSPCRLWEARTIPQGLGYYWYYSLIPDFDNLKIGDGDGDDPRSPANRGSDPPGRPRPRTNRGRARGRGRGSGIPRPQRACRRMGQGRWTCPCVRRLALGCSLEASMILPTRHRDKAGGRMMALVLSAPPPLEA